MDYKFNIEKGEFILYNPETGKDWSNNLFNDLGYIANITHLGTISSRYLDKTATQVVLNYPLSSFLYIRDNETKKYWNISSFPSLNKVSSYKCVHAQDYTKISSKAHKISSSITYVVSLKDTREIWKVELKNESDKIRKIDLFATTEFDLNGFSQPVYYCAATTNYTEYIKEINCIYDHNLNPFRPYDLCNGYIISSEPVKAYDGSKEKFFGTCGTITKPYILEKGLDSTNSLSAGRPRAGILQNEIMLLPNETKTVYYFLGLTTSKEALINNYKDIIESKESEVENALNTIKYNELKTISPENQFNRIFNYWALHQVKFCTLGKKAVRDNAQLGMALLNFDLKHAKETIDECIIHQYSDGHSVLTWHPYLEPNIYSDPSFWLIISILEYIKESGDFEYLNKKYPYLDKGEGTVYNHLKMAIKWFERKDNYGKNNLPLIHTADWNDALNIPDEKAESVLMGMFIVNAYNELIDLTSYIKDYDYMNELKVNRDKLAKTINDVAYNGKYYVRAFSKYGVVGDETSKNGGNIYVNPQSFSILSNVCPKERLDSVIKAMDSLETKYGIPMCYPPYKTYDESVGRMSGMLEGIYENGGIYNHAGCFKVMADCKLKRGDSAVNALLKIVPDGKYNPSKITTTEPYVFTNCYFKNKAMDMMVGFSWQTGTSAWGLMCYYEGILGLKRSYDGLIISPCVPKTWKKFYAERTFRGNKLYINFINHGGSNISIKIDGKKIENLT